MSLCLEQPSGSQISDLAERLHEPMFHPNCFLGSGRLALPAKVVYLIL